MAQTAPTPRPGTPVRLVKSHRAARVARAVLGPDPAAAAVPSTKIVTANPVWARTQRRFARAAIWTLPGYAMLLIALGLVAVPEADGNFAGYARFVTTDAYRYLNVGTVVGAWLGLVGIVALTGLLAGTRGRYFAIAGLLTGLGGTAVTLPLVGLRGLAEPVIGRVYQSGDAAGAAALRHDLYDTTTTRVALAGAVLSGLGWLLLSIAALRARVLNRTDGYLLMLSALLLGGAWYLPLLRTVAALLFLAATLGLAFTATRLLPRPAQ